MEAQRTPDILIIAAMREELVEFHHANAIYPLKRPSGKPDFRYWELPEYSTNIGFRVCGVGKKRASKDVSGLLKTVRPRMVIVIGYSGTLVSGLNVGEVLIVRKTVHESLLPDSAVSMDEDWIRCCENLFRQKHIGFSCVSAVSADTFVDTKDRKDCLQSTFMADCVDMESHSIAHVAVTEGIPMGMIRAVSDSADETIGLDFSCIPARKWPFRLYFLCRPWLLLRLYRLQVNATRARRNLSHAVRCYLENWRYQKSS